MNFYIAKEPPASHTLGRSLEIATGQIGLPGLTCMLCGQTWAWDALRLHRTLPNNIILRGRSLWPVPTDEFAVIAKQVRQELSLPADYPLLPGTKFGPIRLNIVRSEIPSFEWPGLSSLVITESTANVLTEAGLTGWRPEPIEINTWSRWSLRRRVKPSLCELVVTGSAGTAYTTPFFPVLSVCSLCGRTDYGDTTSLDCQTATVDVKAWDGSDFCRFAGLCWGYVVVTERAKAAVETAHLGNIEFTPCPARS